MAQMTTSIDLAREAIATRSNLTSGAAHPESAARVQSPTLNPPVKAKRGRLIQLDILRGLAVLMVLGFHSPMNWKMAGAFIPLTAFFTRFCWAGVDLFFVLSGFLVGGLLFEEAVRTNALNIPRFLIRRTLKIWPLYYLFLLIMIPVLAMQIGSFAAAAKSIVPAVAFFANYVDVPHLDHMWSISVEEHFYLILPLTFFIAFKLLKPRAAMNLVASIGLLTVLTVAIARSLYLWHKPFDSHSHVEPTHWRIDGLFFGVLLAYVFHVHPETWAKTAPFKLPLAIVGAALLVPCMIFSRVRDPFVYTVGYSFLYVGFGAILIAMMHTKLDNRKNWPVVGSLLGVVAWIGLNSYPVYLWHLPIANVLSSLAADRLLAKFPHTIAWLMLEIPYVVIACVFGAIIGKWIERPTLVVRDRLFPPKAPAVPMAGVPSSEKTPERIEDAVK